jgi:hypothetical protein
MIVYEIAAVQEPKDEHSFIKPGGKEKPWMPLIVRPLLIPVLRMKRLSS